MFDPQAEAARFWAEHAEVLAYWRAQSSRGVWEDSRDHAADWLRDQGYDADRLEAVKAAIWS